MDSVIGIIETINVLGLFLFLLGSVVLKRWDGGSEPSTKRESFLALAKSFLIAARYCGVSIAIGLFGTMLIVLNSKPVNFLEVLETGGSAVNEWAALLLFSQIFLTGLGFLYVFNAVGRLLNPVQVSEDVSVSEGSGEPEGMRSSFD